MNILVVAPTNRMIELMCVSLIVTPAVKIYKVAVSNYYDLQRIRGTRYDAIIGLDKIKPEFADVVRDYNR